MTVGQIESQVRSKLLDTYESDYRYTPSEIYTAIRDGIKRIHLARPVSRYISGILISNILIQNKTPVEFIVPDSFPAEINGVLCSLEDYRKFKLNIDEKWMEALVYYVIHKMYLKDDIDTSNAQSAKNYLDLFSSSVMS